MMNHVVFPLNQYVCVGIRKYGILPQFNDELEIKSLFRFTASYGNFVKGRCTVDARLTHT